MVYHSSLHFWTGGMEILGYPYVNILITTLPVKPKRRDKPVSAVFTARWRSTLYHHPSVSTSFFLYLLIFSWRYQQNCSSPRLASTHSKKSILSWYSWRKFMPFPMILVSISAKCVLQVEKENVRILRFFFLTS